MTIMEACKKNITTQDTAKLFFERVWVHFGIPQSIISDKANSFTENIQHIRQQIHDILGKSNAQYKQQHDQYWVPHKFQVGNKV